MNKKVILTPGHIGKVELKNRVIFPSMCTFFCDEGGFVSEDQLSLVRSLAEGGAGMLIIPGSPHGKVGPGRPALSDDKYIAGWKSMAEVCHENGAKLFCQLHPAAVQAGRDVVVKKVEDYSRELLNMLVESYAAEAERCKEAGVDGVEIHGAHAHEIAQFMSPHYNTRTDEYGGDYIRRAKYPVDIVKAIKKRCGAEYPIIFRISGDEVIEGGRKLPETIQIIRLLIEAGIDAVHVSIGMPESEEYMVAPMDVADCFNVEAGMAVKEAIHGVIPVITVGRITTLEQAEEILETGKVDFTAIGRAQFADHELVNKYMGENKEPVCRCVGCNQGCRAATVRKKIRCMQNAYAGYEGEYTVTEVSPKAIGKKIMIIGAGPAGLQAAMVLAQHGIKPVVYERDDRPGGLLSLASIPPFKAPMERVITYRMEMLEHLGVTVCCNRKVDADFVRKQSPDIVMVATGSTPFVPQIPGLDDRAVFTGDEVIRNNPDMGKKIAIIGGGLIGCETAELLLDKGKDVVLFEMTDDIAGELTESRRTFMLKRLKDAHLEVHTGAEVKSVQLPKLVVQEHGKEKVFDGFDHVVVAAGRKSEGELLAALKILPGTVRVLAIGDASKSALAIDAIHSATAAAMQILKGNF